MTTPLTPAGERAVALLPELLAALESCADMIDDNYESMGYATQPSTVENARRLLNVVKGGA